MKLRNHVFDLLHEDYYYYYYHDFKTLQVSRRRHSLSTIHIDMSEIPDKWSIAAQDIANHSDDFTKWENFIKISESTNSSKLIILSYENLLVKYPYLEQYWINYARWFFKFNNLPKSIETFKRSLKIIPNSILLWNTYLDLLLKIFPNDENLLPYFETARISIGYHYYSSIFYDKYLKFLNDTNLIHEYYLLLRIIIQVPQHQYLKYFKIYLKLIENADLKSIKYIITSSDLKKLTNFKWVDLLINENNFKKLKLELKKKFTDLYITTQFHSWKFYNFEKKLGINYYIPHRELTRLQLQTWRSYLEYVENLNLKVAIKDKEQNLLKNNFNQIDTLYNRCLIVTNEYHFFWIKYSNYYLNLNDITKAKSILINGLYMNPINNLKIRIRLIDLYIITLEFDNAKAIIHEGLKLLPYNYQLFIKLIEIEHFTLPSNVEKLIISKITEISKLKNQQLENQFDYLFMEMLSYSSITVSRLSKIFEKYKNKKSFNYLKARKQFMSFYNKPTIMEDKKFPNGWECEYF